MDINHSKLLQGKNIPNASLGDIFTVVVRRIFIAYATSIRKKEISENHIEFYRKRLECGKEASGE